MGDVDFVDQLAIEKGLDRAVPRLKNVADELPLFEAVVAPTSILVGNTLKEYSSGSYFMQSLWEFNDGNEAISWCFKVTLLSNVALSS